MGKLSDWISQMTEALNDPFADESDYPDCPDCGNKLVFIGHDENGDFPLGDGYWKCSVCGFSITESDLDTL